MYNIAANSTVFSLIQPTGRIHLGNYLGALSAWKDIAKTESSGTHYIFGTADLHSLTAPPPPQDLRKYRREAIASILSSGIDPNNATIFHQLSVPEHAELGWVLTCLTSMGALNRMTQWKSKLLQSEGASIFQDEVLGNTKAGLLCYPILQAADILLYKATHVPVGDDQAQHLELCRGIATTFNSTYGKDFFPLPQTLLTPARKILALRNPSKKMSKSDRDQLLSVYVTDSAEEIARKLRKATTDSIQGRVYYDPKQRPGVSNLLNIVAGLTQRTIEETVADLVWITNHKQLKDHVTELVIAEFGPQRLEYEKLIADEAYLDGICREGTIKAREVAATTMAGVRRLAGLD